MYASLPQILCRKRQVETIVIASLSKLTPSRHRDLTLRTRFLNKFMKFKTIDEERNGWFKRVRGEGFQVQWGDSGESGFCGEAPAIFGRPRGNSMNSLSLNLFSHLKPLGTIVPCCGVASVGSLIGPHFMVSRGTRF